MLLNKVMKFSIDALVDFPTKKAKKVFLKSQQINQSMFQSFS